MEASTFEISDTKTAHNGQKPAKERPILNDKVVLDLAKRRLATKRSLTGQTLDFLLILCTLFLLIVIYDTDERFIISFAFTTFWGCRLLIRIIKFAKPSFKNGISSYFKERKERSIEMEYNRLKKMNAEYVISEINR